MGFVVNPVSHPGAPIFVGAPEGYYAHARFIEAGGVDAWRCTGGRLHRRGDRAHVGLAGGGPASRRLAGPRVAVVVAFRGTVTVEPSPLGEGATFPAVPELQLLRDDRLVVGPDSFVLVALHNGHVVRLNAGASLRVDAMATFDDPPAGTDLEESFARLLSPSERGDAELRGAITRVAGWNTRMSAAETIAPQPPQAPPLMQRLSARIEDDARPVTQDPADASGAEQPSGQVAADRPMGMQSTGQAGTHRSQLTHSA